MHIRSFQRILILCCTFCTIFNPAFAQFPVLSSEALFGDYFLSQAYDIRQCPKKLTILPVKPFTNIPQSYSLPLRNLVFDEVPCTTDPKIILDFDFGGDRDGLVERQPIKPGTCLNETNFETAFSVIPYRYQNGSFGPLVARFEIAGECSLCAYRKNFSGQINEELREYDRQQCQGRESFNPVINTPTSTPIPSPSPTPSMVTNPVLPPILYYIQVLSKGPCHSGGLSVMTGVVSKDRVLVPKGTILRIKVETNYGKIILGSRAVCEKLSGQCKDWRTKSMKITVPRSKLSGKVKVTVYANYKVVGYKKIRIPNYCKI